MDEALINNMRARVAQCRRLAAFTTDQRVAEILLKMAEEGEADLKRLEDEARDRD